jgi:ABC-type polysaccharide/polyol phosphate transport system ATPase subunit
MFYKNMNQDIAIKVENLTKIYKLYNAPIDRLKEALNPFKKKYHIDFYALNNLNFEIKKGDCVGILGKNGAGKSTLLKIITGVLTPTLGTVEINGKVSALLELGAGFNPEYTGIENIYFQGNLMGYSKEEIDAKVPDILEFADIGDFIKQPVKSYSSGMFARLAFAVAINVEPDILIVDEALAVGDAKFVFKCLNKISAMKKNGVTIILVTHDVQTVKTFCQSGIWIKNGAVEQLGLVEEVTNSYIRDLFGGEVKPENVSTISNDSAVYTDSSLSLVNSPHWGSGELLVHKFNISSSAQLGKNSFRYLDEIFIQFTSIVKVANYYPNLAFSFSIKNNKNLDLIVEVIQHNKPDFYNYGEEITAEFRLENILPPGDYLLVLAVEDRSGYVCEYFDYAENVQNFTVFADSNDFFYSVVKPKIFSRVIE